VASAIELCGFEFFGVDQNSNRGRDHHLVNISIEVNFLLWKDVHIDIFVFNFGQGPAIRPYRL